MGLYFCTWQWAERSQCSLLRLSFCCSKIEMRRIGKFVLSWTGKSSDGLNRFASWVNSHKAVNMNGRILMALKYMKAMPRGRTNHYWLTFNRIGFPVQHLIKKSGVKVFQEWGFQTFIWFSRMGTIALSFFQPGFSRSAPLTPTRTLKLTKNRELSAKALDSNRLFVVQFGGYDWLLLWQGFNFSDVQDS